MECPETECCWICLSHMSETSASTPLEKPCRCPSRWVHRPCLARWQLRNAGKDLEYQRCRFCMDPLPDWRAALTPADVPLEAPVMAIVFEGQVHKMRVRSGPQGEADFRAKLAELAGRGRGRGQAPSTEQGLPTGLVNAPGNEPGDGGGAQPVPAAAARDDDVSDMDVSFEFKEPQSGQRIQVTGLDAFGAAVHCAAIAAGQRKLARARTQALKREMAKRVAQQRRLVALRQRLLLLAAASSSSSLGGTSLSSPSPPSPIQSLPGDFSPSGSNGAAMAWPATRAPAGAAEAAAGGNAYAWAPPACTSTPGMTAPQQQVALSHLFSVTSTSTTPGCSPSPSPAPTYVPAVPAVGPSGAALDMAHSSAASAHIYSTSALYAPAAQPHVQDGPGGHISTPIHSAFSIPHWYMSATPAASTAYSAANGPAPAAIVPALSERNAVPPFAAPGHMAGMPLSALSPGAPMMSAAPGLTGQLSAPAPLPPSVHPYPASTAATHGAAAPYELLRCRSRARTLPTVVGLDMELCEGRVGTDGAEGFNDAHAVSGSAASPSPLTPPPAAEANTGPSWGSSCYTQGQNVAHTSSHLHRAPPPSTPQDMGHLLHMYQMRGTSSVRTSTTLGSQRLAGPVGEGAAGMQEALKPHLSRATSVHATVEFQQDGTGTLRISDAAVGQEQVLPCAMSAPRLMRAATLGHHQVPTSTVPHRRSSGIITRRYSRCSYPEAPLLLSRSRSAAVHEAVMELPLQADELPTPAAAPTALPAPPVLPVTSCTRKIVMPPSPFQAAASQALQDPPSHPGRSPAGDAPAIGAATSQGASTSGPGSSGLTTGNNNGFGSPRAPLVHAASDCFSSALNTTRLSTSDHSSWAAVADIRLARTQLRKAGVFDSGNGCSSSAGGASGNRTGTALDSMGDCSYFLKPTGYLQHQPSDQHLLASLTPACSIIIDDCFGSAHHQPMGCGARSVDLSGNNRWCSSTSIPNDRADVDDTSKTAAPAPNLLPGTPAARHASVGAMLCGLLACGRPTIHGSDV